MKATIKVTGCKDCPFCYWEANNSESNSSGSSRCGKEGDRVIAYDTRKPKTPRWCPLKK